MRLISSSTRVFPLAAVLVLYFNVSFADVRPARLFSDHLVLQRNSIVPIWGTADANEKISVQFEKQITSTIADANGKWMVKLKKLNTGGPYTSP
jgi:sialate O-acetylesterase